MDKRIYCNKIETTDYRNKRKTGRSTQGMRLHALCICGTPGGNRTHNGPLGGGCYIHLTTEAYDVLPPRHGGKTKYYSTILFPKKQII